MRARTRGLERHPPPQTGNTRASAERGGRSSTAATTASATPTITRLSAPSTPARTGVDKDGLTPALAVVTTPRAAGPGQANRPRARPTESIERSGGDRAVTVNSTASVAAPAASGTAAATAVVVETAGDDDGGDGPPVPRERHPLPTSPPPARGDGEATDEDARRAPATGRDAAEPAPAGPSGSMPLATPAVDPAGEGGVSLQTIRRWRGELGRAVEELRCAGDVRPYAVNSSSPRPLTIARDDADDAAACRGAHSALHTLELLLDELDKTAEVATAAAEDKDGEDVHLVEELRTHLRHLLYPASSQGAAGVAERGSYPDPPPPLVASAVRVEAMCLSLLRDRREAGATRAALLDRLAAADAREAALVRAAATDFALIEELSRSSLRGRRTLAGEGGDTHLSGELNDLGPSKAKKEEDGDGEDYEVLRARLVAVSAAAERCTKGTRSEHPPTPLITPREPQACSSGRPQHSQASAGTPHERRDAPGPPVVRSCSSTRPRRMSAPRAPPPAPAFFSTEPVTLSRMMGAAAEEVGPLSAALLYEREVAEEVGRLMEDHQRRLSAAHAAAVARLEARHEAERAVWQQRWHTLVGERDELMRRLAMSAELSRVESAASVAGRMGPMGVVDSPRPSGSFHRTRAADAVAEREEAHRRVARAAHAALLELQLRNDQLMAKNRVLQRELDEVRAPTPRSLVGTPYDTGYRQGGSRLMGRRLGGDGPSAHIGRELHEPHPESSMSSTRFVDPAVWIASGGGADQVPSVSLPLSTTPRPLRGEAHRLEDESSYIIRSAALDGDSPGSVASPPSSPKASSTSTVRGPAAPVSPIAPSTRPPSEA